MKINSKLGQFKAT